MNNEQSAGSRTVQLATLAAKAARIAAAASSGGLYGAAAETVRQFLPQVIKITAILIIILLLLPVLIFAGIPHFLFGWTDNGSADIIEFTSKALLAKDTYLQYDSLLDAEVRRLLFSVNTDGYDEVEVNRDVGNTNMQWLSAIISVRYMQDLDRITPALIADAIADTLVMNTLQDNLILRIFIKDPGPEALMLKYGFSEEQKQWVRSLHESMTEDQTIGENTSGVDYGNVTYRDGSTTVTYYHQNDARWGSMSYGVTGTIGRSGCGPTSLAMVVSSLAGKEVSPVEVADWASQNGYYVEGVGSKHSLIPDGARHYGLSVEGIGKNAQKTVDALVSGKLVVAIMSRGHFTSKGHFIVLRGVTQEGKILVADSNSKARSEQLWDLQTILNEVNRNADAGGPLWVVGT